MFIYNQYSSWALPLLRSSKLLKLSLHMMCPLSVSSICKEVNVKHLFNIIWKCGYRKMGNVRVVQFSRYFAVSHEPRKLKSAKYFPSLTNCLFAFI